MPTNDAAHAFLAETAGGPAYAGLGAVFRFLADGRQTGGRFALLEVLAPAGIEPPPHVHHREDESYYVLDGRVTFRCGDRTFVAGPGEFVFLPQGVPHAWKIETATTRMLIHLAPAGLEEAFRACCRPTDAFVAPPAPTGPPADVEAMLRAFEARGIEFLLGPPPSP